MEKQELAKIMAELGASPEQRMLNMMARLRDKETGCEWDIAQNFKTIAPYTIEEAYEVMDAIEREDMVELKSELGDLLLQVIFHAQMAEEEGLFNFADIADGLVIKMIKRHPHVFGDKTYQNLEAQKQDWEDIKAKERKDTNILDGIALSLPALMRAVKLQNRAARIGFDWDKPEQVLEKITEEASEIVQAKNAQEPLIRIEEEVGDLLFAVSNLARKLNIDPEIALRRANDKFVHRFELMEEMAKAANRPMQDYSLEELEELWLKAKSVAK